MKDMIKKYIPYAAVILAVYLLVPLIFLSNSMKGFSPVAYYFIFPATAIVCSALYSAKNGLDFLFSLIAPVIYLPSMFIYNGGFSSTNIILLVAYLIAGIFGLFVGDIAFGDKRRQQEQKEKAQAEEMLIEANRIDEIENEKRAEKIAAQNEKSPSEDDDFDYDKYSSDFGSDSTEDEIDSILNEFGSTKD